MRLTIAEFAALVQKEVNTTLKPGEIVTIIKDSEKYKNCFVTKMLNNYVDGDIDEIKEYVVSVINAKQALETAEQEAKEAAEREHNAALASILITSGYSFEGYKIVKYSGYISGDDAVNVDRGFGNWGGNVGDKLMASLVVIRRNALRELKEAALALGCNAVIGVDFDYLTLDPQTANATGGTTYYPYVFGVTANGNAVVIEKE